MRFFYGNVLYLNSNALYRAISSSIEGFFQEIVMPNNQDIFMILYAPSFSPTKCIKTCSDNFFSYFNDLV